MPLGSFHTLIFDNVIYECVDVGGTPKFIIAFVIATISLGSDVVFHNVPHPMKLLHWDISFYSGGSRHYSYSIPACHLNIEYLLLRQGTKFPCMP